jgi:hypothetical protein
MELRDLQKIQSKYDESFWQHNGTQLEKIRHITLHLGKLLGKLSTYCERHEHNEAFDADQIVSEVIPDLLMYSFQLSNSFGVDPGDLYLKRLNENVARNANGVKKPTDALASVIKRTIGEI